MLRTAAGAAAALVLATGAPPAGAQDAELPVAGTFSFHVRNDDSQPLAYGAVHAVRRVPGGTAVYYSVGVPEGQTLRANEFMPVPGLGVDYRAVDLAGIALVDTDGLRYYQPMVSRDGCLCPEVAQFGRTSGQLRVGWAVVPPLPANVTTVSVDLGYGVQVEDVPVGNGALEPAVAQASTVLGEGWPALPDQAAVEAVPDPDRYVRSLVRNRADLDRVVTTAERSGQVAESLSSDVLFPVDSAVLTPRSRATLAALAERLRTRAAGAVTVTGHADSTGTPARNLPLSLARARAVRDALRAAGVDAPLQATGVGEREPVADNSTEQGRRLNRRVTVSYPVKGDA